MLTRTDRDDYSIPERVFNNHTNAVHQYLFTMQVRNSITLIGNLGSAPSTTKMPNGRSATEFSLATNDYFRDKNGDRQTRTEWHKIKAYGKLAEVFDQHLMKGSQVCIAGALRYNKWIDKHDQVRVTAEIVADSFTFLSGGKKQDAEVEMTVGMVGEPDPATEQDQVSDSGSDSRKSTARKAKAYKAPSRRKTPPRTTELDTTGADLPF